MSMDSFDLILDLTDDCFQPNPGWGSICDRCAHRYLERAGESFPCHLIWKKSHGGSNEPVTLYRRIRVVNGEPASFEHCESFEV